MGKIKGMIIAVVLVGLVAVFVAFKYTKFLQLKNKAQNSKKLFNIVMVGAAGSGKGTQSDLIKAKLNMLQISAGDVLRNFVKNNPDAKETKIIKEYADNGKLVPHEITHKLMRKIVEEKVFCDGCQYSGIIFDGFPREMIQLKFLDKMLKDNGNQIDAVVAIDIEMEKLVERLSGRFMCAKCGEIYHKVSHPTKKEGVCDKCGSTEFKVRDDDQNTDAIRARFRIFEENTKPVLAEYEKRGIVIYVDGTKGAKEISDELLIKLQEKKDLKK